MPERHRTRVENAGDNAEKAEAKKPLRLTAHYSFYDDDGSHKVWSEGAVVTDPEEIELLTGRGAPVEEITE